MICPECRLYEIDKTDPAHRLCPECLAEYRATWRKLDKAYLENQ